MVVTTSTGRRQSEKRLGININLVVDDFHLIVECVDRHKAQFDHSQVRRPDRRLVEVVVGIPPRLRQQVSREMFTHQLVVGHIGIEGPYQIVAIQVRIRQLRIALAAVRFAVPHQVHPVSRPAFAKPGRIQQSINDRLERQRRFVREKHLDLVRRRWQSSQCKGRATQQRPLVRPSCWLQSVLLQFGQHEPIDRMLRPRLVLHGGRFDAPHWL